MREDSPDPGAGEAGDARRSPGDAGAFDPHDRDLPGAPPHGGDAFDAPGAGDEVPLWRQGIGTEPPLPAVRGLSVWLLLILLFGGGGLVLGQQEMAALTALGGLYVAAHASDLDRRWRSFYLLVAWVAPVGGALMLGSIGMLALRGDLPMSSRVVAVAVAFAGAALSLMTLFRPVAAGLARMMFRAGETTHVMRLSARLITAGFLAALPGWFVFRDLFDTLLTEPSALFDQVTFGTGLIGYVLLAAASVGFLVRRGLRPSLERLGITSINMVQMAVVAGGVVALFVLNYGADWIQHHYFPALWDSDHAINEAIAGGLGVGQVLMLGLSAGVGEEITLRGALQPRFGVVPTALLFASLHVQYSWFGMLVIFALGLILGVIRARTSTTVAILIHTLYDIAAVFSV